MRYKGRRFASLKAKRSGKSDTIRSYAATFEEAVEVEEEEADRDQVIALPAGQVARVKRFPMKPMTVEEASTQMELLGHGFFCFFNGTSGEYNVLYRRHDEDYTVIEPELG